MNKSYLFLIASVLVFLSLAGSVSAGEETVSISVDVPMAHGEILGDGETTNVSRVPTWYSMDIALGENFTFTFIADNLVNGTEYAFSYEIRDSRMSSVSATHLFIANNTDEYSHNLEGVFNHTTWHNCSRFSAKVSFVKDPNGLNETLETFHTKSEITEGFRSSDFIYETCYPCYQCNDDSGYWAFLGIFIIAPTLFILSVYKVFRTNDETWGLFWYIMLVVSILIFSYFWIVPL